AYDAEGVDKPNMNLPFGQDQLIEAVLKANPKTIIVLMGGGPVDMSAWADDAQGIIEGWYPGMEGGNALAKVIFGEVNPSGKLPMTFPAKLEDSPAHQLGDFPGKNGVANYNEDIYVGYRYFDTYKVTPRFAFGHGLSYTSFSYRDLKVNASGKQVEVSLSIKNTGGLDGSEIIQLYVHDEQSEVKRPEKELKGFVKVFLKAGEEQVVKMVLPPSAFKYFDEQTAQWKLEKGKFMIMAGASSRDIRLQENVDL
ncbi:MAG: glycosyl hydrolase, partial [Sphingobacteriales bacterium]